MSHPVSLYSSQKSFIHTGSPAAPAPANPGKKKVLTETGRRREARRQGGLAQLARAPALQAGGQRFESVILHIFRKKEGKAIYDMMHTTKHT